MNLNTTDINTGKRCTNPANILLPSAGIFLSRCARFENLADEHTPAGWFAFLGRITQAQHRQLLDYPSLLLPNDDYLAFTKERSLPPLQATSWPRDPYWRQALSGLIQDILPFAPEPSKDILRELRLLAGTSLEALANRVLRMEFPEEDAAFVPFVAAALQVHWTALASNLDPAKISRLGVPGICPCCGFLPVASIVYPEGEIPNLRYLHCGLCSTQWHLVRVTCASCGDCSNISFRYIEGGNGAVRAETCDVCGQYLKIIYREKSPEADPVADDLATPALDIMVQEAGYQRMSPDLLFVPGSSYRS